MNATITHAEVQQIRQAAIFEGRVTRDQARRLAQSWRDQHHALTSLHAADADGNCGHCTRGRVYPVPAPCETVRALAGGGEGR